MNIHFLLGVYKTVDILKPGVFSRFEPFTETEHAWPPTPNYENTTFMLICYYFLVIGAFVFSHAGPFLKPFFTNCMYVTHYSISPLVCKFLYSNFLQSKFETADIFFII